MSSGFITETEIAEKRRLRQEEWERVRQPHDPKEAPEQEYDHRSLFERLEEQRKKKDVEFEEAHSFKNLIKGLDNDEVSFLALVDKSKMEQERKKTVEEEKEMEDFRNRVASMQEKLLEKKMQTDVKQPTSTTKANNSINSAKTSQTKLLAGAVKKRPLPKENDVESSKKAKTEKSDSSAVPIIRQGSLTCIGILPGLGHYEDSSDSDNSSEYEEEHPIPPVKVDLLGRPLQNEVIKK